MTHQEQRLIGFGERPKKSWEAAAKQNQSPWENAAQTPKQRFEKLRKDLRGTTGIAREKVIVGFLSANQSSGKMMNIGVAALEHTDLTPILDPKRINGKNMRIPHRAMLIMTYMLRTGPQRKISIKAAAEIAQTMRSAGRAILSQPLNTEEAREAYFYTLYSLVETAHYYFGAGTGRPPNRAALEDLQKMTQAAAKRINNEKELPANSPWRKRLQHVLAALTYPVDNYLKLAESQ